VVRKIVLKVFLPDGGDPLVKRFHAPPRHHYSAENIQQAIDECIEKLDAAYPRWNFRMVRVGAGAVNFIYDGERASAPG
jgi:hypothetical protein